jgi:hypothetical protein
MWKLMKFKVSLFLFFFTFLEFYFVFYDSYQNLMDQLIEKQCVSGLLGNLVIVVKTTLIYVPVTTGCQHEINYMYVSHTRCHVKFTRINNEIIDNYRHTLKFICQFT